MAKPATSTIAGLTLLEVILVIALLAGMMAYTVGGLLPTKDHISTFLALQTQIKSTFDSAVLTSIPHRMVFDIKNHRIFVQRIHYKNPDESRTKTFSLPLQEEWLGLDEQAALKEQSMQEFETYKELAGEEVKDLDTNQTIPPRSPVLQALQYLMGLEWVEAGEFVQENLYFKDLHISRFFVEHLQTEYRPSLKASPEEEKEFFLYFYPHGYVEKAYIVFEEIDDNGDIMEDTPPFVITTLPHEGMAELSSNTDSLQETP